jgi:hypothetical protein
MLCIGLPQEKGKNSITETPYALLTHRNNDNLEMASLSPIIIAMCRTIHDRPRVTGHAM